MRTSLTAVGAFIALASQSHAGTETLTISDGPYLASSVAATIDPSVEGTIVNTTLTVDFPLDAFGDPIETWNIRLLAPIRNGPDSFIFTSVEFSDEDFTFDGAALSGTVTSDALNGEIFETPDLLGGWETETFSDSGTPGFWGFGTLTWTVDVIPVPSPVSVAPLAALGLIVQRRRR